MVVLQRFLRATALAARHDSAGFQCVFRGVVHDILVAQKKLNDATATCGKACLSVNTSIHRLSKQLIKRRDGSSRHNDANSNGGGCVPCRDVSCENCKTPSVLAVRERVRVSPSFIGRAMNIILVFCVIRDIISVDRLVYSDIVSTAIFWEQHQVDHTRGVCTIE